jgi:hypothetical protein
MSPQPAMPAATANGDPPHNTILTDPNVVNVVNATFEGFPIVDPPFGFVSSYGVLLNLVYSQPDIEMAQRRPLAELFAQVVANLSGVEEVWLDSTTPELEVTLIMRALNLERELELRGIFISLTDASEPSAELSVFAIEDVVPDWAREGERLT